MPRKFTSLLFIVLATTVWLSGCGNGGESSGTESEPVVSGPSGTVDSTQPPGGDDGNSPIEPVEVSDDPGSAPDSGVCNVLRDYYDGTGSWGYLTIGRHYNDAARITVTGNYTACKLRLKMYQYNSDPQDRAEQIFNVSIFSHDTVRNAPGQRIGQPSARINAGSIIQGETNTIEQAQGNYTAMEDVYFDLDVPVTPGTYWLVFKTHNYDGIDWRQRLRNNIVPDSSNAYPLRGRALSYSPDPAGIGEGGWEEFYSCQVRYALYSK